MEPATDSIKAAVEAKCQSCGGSGMELRGSPPQPQGGECSDCHGTGRKYPSLSRVCPGRRYIDMSGEHKISHSVPIRGRRCRCAIISNGSGRVPDVTLEKVLDLIGYENQCISFGWSFDTKQILCDLSRPVNGNFIRGAGNTPLEAACAALMEDY